MPSAAGKGKRRGKALKRSNPFAKARGDVLNTDREIRSARKSKFTQRNRPY